MYLHPPSKYNIYNMTDLQRENECLLCFYGKSKYMQYILQWKNRKWLNAFHSVTLLNGNYFRRWRYSNRMRVGLTGLRWGVSTEVNGKTLLLIFEFYEWISLSKQDDWRNQIKLPGVLIMTKAARSSICNFIKVL